MRKEKLNASNLGVIQRDRKLSDLVVKLRIHPPPPPPHITRRRRKKKVFVFASSWEINIKVHKIEEEHIG